jgi:hypothetical protein
MKPKPKRIFASLTAALLLLAFAAVPVSAFASSASQGGYSEAGPITEVTQAAGNASASAPIETGTSSVLPFTGLDLAIVLLLGVALLGVGLLLRRASRSTSA